ncbi:MAG: GIY-YIG nuclease family protein [bacterium]|nr:GIY-YIG nuclease family protein [bacterium]
MYYVYLIQCEDGTIYTGTTNNLERRFGEHKDRKGGHYTQSHNVEKVLYTEQFPTRSEAMRREVQIKGWRREKKLHLIKFAKPTTSEIIEQFNP